MIEIQTFSGAGIAPWLDAVAQLHATALRDWPYLREGDRACEARSLAPCAASPDSLFVIAFDRDRLVGASTGVPLVHEATRFHRPFHERGIAIGDVFHFGESILLDEYRGHGLGHRFFDEREAHARRLGRFGMTAFCSVMRDPADPRRPANERRNDLFWTKRGYRRQHDMTCELEWREVGMETPATQQLCYWLRPLEQD